MDSSEQSKEITRRYLTSLIAVVTGWRAFLVLRQILMVSTSTTVPQALAKGMTQTDFTTYRQLALFSLYGNMFELVRGAVAAVTRMYKGYPAWIWSLTAKYANTLESRVLLYPVIEIFMANWFGMILIVIACFMKWNVMEALTLYLYVVSIMIASAVMTYGLMFLTNKWGVSVLLYAAIPLNVLEMLNIIVVIELVLPSFCRILPQSAMATLHPVAKQVNFPPSRIYMLPEDSTDYSPNAAYMGLLGFKIIIITESLLKAVGLIDTRSVLAHELGHWARGHMAVGVTTRLIQTIISCFMFSISYSNDIIFNAYGFSQQDYPHPVIGVLICWQYILPILNALILGVSTALSYVCEYEADQFAVKMGLGEGLINALTTIMSSIKRFPLFDSWYAAWFIGHPDILDRVDRIKKAIA